MRSVDPLKIAVVGAIVLVLAGCETTWRRSTMHHVQMDGREISTSWIRMQADEIDVSVWEDPAFQGFDPRPSSRLDRKTAARAAEIVVDQLCSDRFVAAPLAATYAEGRHAFRYRCVDQ